VAPAVGDRIRISGRGWPRQSYARLVAGDVRRSRAVSAAGTVAFHFRIAGPPGRRLHVVIRSWRRGLRFPVVLQERGAAFQPRFPIRAAFYYPWFPEAWRQRGIE